MFRKTRNTPSESIVLIDFTFLLWEQEVAGSNPAAPTLETSVFTGVSSFLDLSFFLQIVAFYAYLFHICSANVPQKAFNRAAMITARLIYVNHGDPSKKGYPLKIIITKARKKKYLHWKRYCQPEHWDLKKDLPRNNCPDKSLRRDILAKRAELEVKEVELNQKDLSLENCVKYLEASGSVSEMGLLQFYDLRIQELKDTGRSYRAYQDMRSQLEHYFEKDIPIKEVSYTTVQKFSTYKLKGSVSALGKKRVVRKCSPNGLRSYLSNWRAVHNEARRRGLVNGSNPFEGNMPAVTRPPKRALPKNEIQKLFEYQPMRQSVNRYLDLWKLQFFLGGVDLVELREMTWDQIRFDRFVYLRNKLRNRGQGAEIDVKIYPEAKKIIERLTKRKKRVLDLIPEDPDSYKNFRDNMNTALRRIKVKLNLTNPLSTKSPRHTFRTIAGELGVNQIAVEQIQGHQSQDTTFIYQDKLSQQVRDQAHREIINYAICSDNPQGRVCYH